MSNYPRKECQISGVVVMLERVVMKILFVLKASSLCYLRVIRSRSSSSGKIDC
jgi:hypothetical protein